MYLFFVALHVVLCVLLVLIIILQPGKGGDVGAAFGGGGSNMFGPRGPTGILQQATTIVAMAFMGTSITLALYSNRSVLDDADLSSEIQRQVEEAEKKKKEKATDPQVEAPPDDAPSAVP